MEGVFVGDRKFYHKHHSEKEWLLTSVLNGPINLLLMQTRIKPVIVQPLVLVALIQMVILMVKNAAASQMLQVCYPKIMNVIVTLDIIKLLVRKLTIQLIIAVMHALVICITT